MITIRLILASLLLCGLVYLPGVRLFAKIFFPENANGSLVRNSAGEIVGSRLIAQNFISDRYFHPRPSAAGEGYDGSSSSGANLGPTNAELLDSIEERVAAYREENELDSDTQVPVDAVTASSSGLDPHISIANARLQAPRVAEARGLDIEDVLSLIGEHTDGRDIGFLGEPGVNVLLLNLALDAAR